MIALATCVGLVACGRDRAPRAAPGQAAPGGTVVIATAGDVESLVPLPGATTTARQFTDLVFEPLAELGPALNTAGDAGFEPRLALSWTWAPDSLTIAFHLDPRAHFHDGTPVRAADVRFTFDLARDPALGSSGSTDLAGIDSVAVRDSLTPVFWFSRRSPEQFYAAVGTLRILPAARLRGVAAAELARSSFAAAPVGSGPFRFAARTPGARLEIVANATYHLGRPLLDRVVWSVTPDPATAIARMLAGEADIFEALRPEQLSTLARQPVLTTLSSAGLYNGFLQFNLDEPGAPAGSGRPHPLFADRALRRALAAALDRRTMVRNVFDTLAMVSLGPFTRAQATADTTVAQPVFDPAGAARALDALGWRPRGADGVREKGGRRLSFTLLVPVSSQARLRYAVLIQEQLRRVGVEVRVEPLDFATYNARLDAREFDASVAARVLDPSPRGLREDWGSASAAAARGTNYGGYASPAFDAAVDRALAAPTRAAAAPWFHRAYQTVVDDAPAVWLFEPRLTLAIHRRLRVTGARPGAWWAGMARWSVAPGQEIARDRIGRGR